MNFSEDFLHYIWQFRSFDHTNLETANGESLNVLYQGFHNKNAGPDFHDAKIQVGETIWAGNIEIHIKSSDWLKHKHQNDAAYDNVILHVVYENDAEVKRHDNSVLPVLELKNRIDNALIEKYENLFLTLTDFPCIAQIRHVDKLIVDSFLSRTLIERFEEKANAVSDVLHKLNGSWADTFHYFLSRNFGFKVNALPFELLAKNVSLQIYGKHKNNPLQIEALVFGAAGFLNDNFDEAYPISLKREFEFLQNKYRIKPLEVSVWKFMRMRPQNFPTLRLAQFASLIVNASHLFSKILATQDVNALRQLFENLPVNPYWHTHYHFKKQTKRVNTRIGKASVDNILLNTVALFLFAYGKYTGDSSYISRAVKLLERLPAELNAVTEKFTSAGVIVDNAFGTQGLMQLKQKYCDQKKCLSCTVGIKILRQV